jgi:hypothetical protein
VSLFFHPFLPLFLLPPLYTSFCLTFPSFSSAVRSFLFKTLKWVVHTGKQTNKQIHEAESLTSQ